MIDVAVQLKNGILYPFSEEDSEALKNYKNNQILRAKISGVEKPRSLEQLRMYWACAKTVAENMKDKTKEDIDFFVKIKVAKQHPSLIKRYQSIDGVVFMEPLSISYANMKHLTANKYFDLALPVMADIIGITKDELLRNAE